MGAGARIGLVTGLIAGWFAFSATGLAFFCMRYWFHQGQAFDQVWQSMVTESVNQQLRSMSENAQAMNAFKNMLLSPEGRAGIMLTGMVVLEAALLVFAAAGGALGARLMARARRPEA